MATRVQQMGRRVLNVPVQPNWVAGPLGGVSGKPDLLWAQGAGT